MAWVMGVSQCSFALCPVALVCELLDHKLATQAVFPGLGRAATIILLVAWVGQLQSRLRPLAQGAVSLYKGEAGLQQLGQCFGAKWF